MNVAKIALSGYNAETDTNPDHFSLLTDEDNVLIKRFSRGSGSIDAVTGDPDYITETITHNLNYIPFFTVFANSSGDKWSMLNNCFNAVSVPDAISAIKGDNLYITNFLPQSLNYAYDIFYDDMSLSGNPTITESKKVFKIARVGKSATSLNPNDYIIHSDLNNMKILKQGNVSMTLTPDGFGYGSTSFNHGASIETPYKYFLFVKFPDGKTAFIAGGHQGGYTHSYDGNYAIFLNQIDSSKIYFNFYCASAIDVEVSYIIYGTATDNSLVEGDKVIKCVSAGYNAETEKNPENFNFHSSYPTLKYHVSDTWDMGTINTNTVKTIAHNLGYVPFFIAFVCDLAQIIYDNSYYCIAPFIWGRSTLGSPDRDIRAYVYADENNLYLKASYGANAIGTNVYFNWYYKLFKNNLNL